MLEKKKKCKEPESKKSLKFNSMINLDKHSNSINFQTRNDLKLDVPYKKIKTQIQDLEAIGEIDYLNQIKSVKTNNKDFKISNSQINSPIILSENWKLNKIYTDNNRRKFKINNDTSSIES